MPLSSPLMPVPLKTYSDPSYIFSGGQDSPVAHDLRPWLHVPWCCVAGSTEEVSNGQNTVAHYCDLRSAGFRLQQWLA